MRSLFRCHEVSNPPSRTSLLLLRSHRSERRHKLVAASIDRRDTRFNSRALVHHEKVGGGRSTKLRSGCILVDKSGDPRYMMVHSGRTYAYSDHVFIWRAEHDIIFWSRTPAPMWSVLLADDSIAFCVTRWSAIMIMCTVKPCHPPVWYHVCIHHRHTIHDAAFSSLPPPPVVLYAARTSDPFPALASSGSRKGQSLSTSNTIGSHR